MRKRERTYEHMSIWNLFTHKIFTIIHSQHRKTNVKAIFSMFFASSFVISFKLDWINIFFSCIASRFFHLFSSLYVKMRAMLTMTMKNGRTWDENFASVLKIVSNNCHGSPSTTKQSAISHKSDVVFVDRYFVNSKKNCLSWKWEYLRNVGGSNKTSQSVSSCNFHTHVRLHFMLFYSL